MKIFYLLSLLLTGCASQGTYNNQQVKTQCAIGYHQVYSVYTVSNDSDKKNQKDEKKPIKREEFHCVADSDQDKLVNPGHY